MNRNNIIDFRLSPHPTPELGQRLLDITANTVLPEANEVHPVANHNKRAPLLDRLGVKIGSFMLLDVPFSEPSIANGPTENIVFARGGNYAVVRKNLSEQGKLNSKAPMSAEQKKIRRRKRKKK